jgi:peroxiredoxin
MQSQRRLKLGIAAPWILVGILAVSNAAMIRQNFAMRESFRKNEPSTLQTGERVPPFTAKAINGDPVSIGYSGQGPKKVFFYFTPPCKFCRQQFPYWRDFLTHADANRLEVIGLVSETEDLTRLANFLDEMKCSQDSPVALKVVLVSADVLSSYKLSPTPVTLIVSNRGTVEGAWIGLWDEASISAATSLLGLTLPSRR